MYYTIAAPENWVRIKSIDTESLSFRPVNRGGSLSAGLKGFKSGGKNNAQLPIVTIKNNVLLTVFFHFLWIFSLFNTSFCATCPLLTC